MNKITIPSIADPLGYIVSLPLRLTVGVLISLSVMVLGELSFRKETWVPSIQSGFLPWFVTLPIRVVAMSLVTIPFWVFGELKVRF